MNFMILCVIEKDTIYYHIHHIHQIHTDTTYIYKKSLLLPIIYNALICAEIEKIYIYIFEIIDSRTFIRKIKLEILMNSKRVIFLFRKLHNLNY